jgi:parallel beta-helix repeat protein
MSKNRRFGIAGIIGLFLAGAALATSTASANSLWVDVLSLGGACSDDRTRDQVGPTTPWCGLGAAGVQALAGDVVNVRRGTYSGVQTCASCNDDAVLQVVNSGTDSAWIRFQAVPGEEVVISGAGGALNGILVVRTHDGREPRYVSVQGFAVKDFPRNCVRAKDTTDVILQGMDITGCGKGSMELHNTARVTVEGNRIHDNQLGGWTSAVDLYKCRAGNVVRGNYIWGNQDVDSRESEGHGITMDYCLAAGGALIENNVIWNNEGWCIAIYFSDGGIVRNNTCWMNATQRPKMGELSVLGRNHRIHNNILVPGPGRLALKLRERRPEYTGHLDTVKADYNLMWAPTHGRIVGWSFGSRGSVADYRSQTSYGWGGSAIQADPRLANPDRRDFQPMADSPAIDSGNGTNAASIDAAGQPRPQDGMGLGRPSVDRGAFEYRIRRVSRR